MNLELLRNVWYVAGLSRDLKAGRFIKMVILNEPIVVMRDSGGRVHALRDICPHRGIPLSYGRVVNDHLECPYHGWKFSGDGVCRSIPSLCEGQDLDCTKIRVRSFPSQEKNGLIWVFCGEKGADPQLAPPVPDIPSLVGGTEPKVVEVAKFKCHIDHAVIGLMDPAHGPYVHRSWLWRSERSMIAKRKKFGPVDFGFQMRRHRPSANSKAYKILGGDLSTEITFRLPGVRVEHIQVGRRGLVALTALTPVNERETVIHQIMYWDIPWLNLIRPFLKWFTHFFLYQDIEAVEKQQDGLRFDPSLMLINDADTQAKWYYSLKEAWVDSQTERRPFVNPVKETELQWRS